MKKQLKDVQDFQETFKLLVNQKPTIVDMKTYSMRYDLMEEENNEYLEACMNKDIIEIADALGDKLYILLGTILTHGMQHVIEDVFDEIHRSNMSKLDAQGNPIYRKDGKVLKGPTYFRPDIKKYL